MILPGQTVLVIVVKARKAQHIERWEKALRAELPDLVSLRVIDVTGDPQPKYEQVAEKMRKRAPEDVSILIDMGNHWALEYELDTNEPCLLIIDANQQLVATFRGRAKKSRVAEVKAALQPWFATQEAVE